MFYLDNIDFGILTTTKNLLPRILEYPDRLIKLLEKEDKCQINEKGMAIYGKNEVRIKISKTIPICCEYDVLYLSFLTSSLLT